MRQMANLLPKTFVKRQRLDEAFFQTTRGAIQTFKKFKILFKRKIKVKIFTDSIPAFFFGHCDLTMAWL